MPRDKLAVRRRLQQAALDLYRERGFDQTTTTAIAARAGVTERTFFRHFADKREVLFDDGNVLRDALFCSIASAPKSLGPLKAVLRAFGSVEQMFIDGRAIAEPREAIIASTPALRERALTKNASLTAAIAAALRERGVGAPLAVLAAQTAMAAFIHAAASWRDDPSTGLKQHLDAASDALRTLSASRPSQVANDSKDSSAAAQRRVRRH